MIPAASAIITATILALRGTEMLVAVAAGIFGAAIGGIAWLVLVIASMEFSADEAGYGQAMGITDNDEPTLLFQLVDLSTLLVPAPAAVLATLGGSWLVGGVDRELLLIAVVIAVVVFAAWATWLVASGPIQQKVEAASVRRKWLSERDASARADPELAAALASEGWRPDGAYDEMRAAYFRAWERVKRARRAEGRPTFGPRDPGGE